MRSAGWTNFGLEGVVVSCTNVMMAFLAAPSFQEGNGSTCSWARATKARQANVDSTNHLRFLRCMAHAGVAMASNVGIVLTRGGETMVVSGGAVQRGSARREGTRAARGGGRRAASSATSNSPPATLARVSG